MEAFFKWLLGLVIDRVLAAIGAVIAAGRRDQANRDAGAAEAVIEGQKQEDAALDRARRAMDEADKRPIEYRD